MRISVIIPSLNEADSISNAVKIADEGLKRFYPNSEKLIINSDGPSDDNTRDVFINTETESEKMYLSNSKAKICGKGTNICSGFEKLNNSDVVVVLDADVKSSTPEWIKMFVDPIINDSCDLVTPLYTRNRYEGNTTNHFSAPLLRACLGCTVEQPIAGDFSLSPRLVNKVVNSCYFDSDYKYGIDTLISWTAIGSKMKVKQVKLGRKIHKPSFPKISDMFTQVAYSTFGQVIKYKNQILESIDVNKTRGKGYSSIDDTFAKKPNQNEIQKLSDLSKELLMRIPKSAMQIVDNPKIYDEMDSKNWAELLSSLVYKLLSDDTDSSLLRLNDYVNVVKPAYLNRVLKYFSEVNGLTSLEVNNLLQNESFLITQKLKHKFSKTLEYNEQL